MINYESIKSLYNDKPTLLQWLKKVEEALSDATLTDVTPTEISPGVFTLTFTFDDGTTITTSNINIPQGVQGVSITGATITSGNLVLALSDGSTINAGNLGGVSSFSIDANQHLIVNYQNGTTQDLGAIFSGNINISGDLSVTGDAKILENITDANGHPRFIEDVVENSQPLYVTSIYNRWSLSGTHLMIVFAGYVNSGEGLTIGSNLFRTMTLPSWILNKVYPVGTSNTLARTTLTFYNDNWDTIIGSCPVRLGKGSTSLLCDVQALYTAAQDSYFRLQFDLLIDNQ